MENVDSKMGNPTALIVDDSPDDLALISGILKDLYTVKIANNGERALQVTMTGTPVDIILLDIMMPVMDGYETCRQLKADPKTRDIPVIFLTAKTEVADEVKGFELGAVDYITKPISPSLVLARVQTHLQLKQVRDYFKDKNSFLEAEVQRRKQAEEELCRHQEVTDRLAQEMVIIAEIGKVVGSTLDIEEVYESFASDVRKLISFDRLAVNLHSPHDEYVRVAYVFGEAISGRGKGELFPLKGSVSEVLTKTREGLYSYRGEGQEIDQPFDNYAATIQEGLRSLMGAPLIYRDEVIGSLHFRSKKPNAYTEQDLRLAEKIGAQIAGAIANAQLYADLKKTEQELKESEERYRELSIVDDLTQLYNSRHFYFQLKIELDRSNRYKQPLTLLLLDLDNFKAFNDTYGHVEGDQVLSRLGQVVKRCLRETDFAYRYGGEEFTVLLPMTTSADGVITAERIRTEFKKEVFSPAPGQEVHKTVSIGLAQYRPQEEMKAFVHRADQLMYQGKKNGKDRVCSES